MDPDLVRLYSVLGYEDFEASGLRARVEAADAFTDEAASEVAGPLHLEAVISDGTPDPGEPSPLGPAEIEELQRQFEQDPESVLEWYREMWDARVTEEDVREALSQAQTVFRAPASAAVAIEAELDFHRAEPLPDGFHFEGLDLDAIPINPGLRKFETKADALGWALFSGPPFVASALLAKAPFRWHNHPLYHSGFVYEMAEPTAETPVDIALFSDFGTGLYHSRYIARQLERRQFPYAIHLGDVYYAGRRSEFRDNFEQPLNPILDTTELFTLNANHEMYSGGIPYFDYIDRRRALGNQRQEGSYFCLRSERFQVLGVDTAYFGMGRYAQAGLQEWLEKHLAEGKQNGCCNILLTPDHPFEYGRPGLTRLLTHDLRRVVRDKKLVDLWFWGNTHYAALFDRTDTLPFISSCIGHGGYPYSRIRAGRSSPAPVIFLETAPRFPEWTHLRQDRGNNGYCVLSLKGDGSLTLTYVDWMSNVRFRAEVGRRESDGLQITTSALG
jgi:hypothetical protein